MASLFGKIGRREIHSDAFPRQRQSDGGQRRAHPLAAFADRLVGKTHQIELAIAAIGDMNLHIDFARFDALKGHCVDMGDGHDNGKATPAAAPAINKRTR